MSQVDTVVSQPAAPAVTQDDATRMFSLSVMVSGIRCTLAYVVFPWLLPAVGISGATGPGFGIPISLVAIAFNIASIRRFHAADHKWKWPITALNSTVISFLMVLLVLDVHELLT